MMSPEQKALMLLYIIEPYIDNFAAVIGKEKGTEIALECHDILAMNARRTVPPDSVLLKKSINLLDRAHRKIPRSYRPLKDEIIAFLYETTKIGKE
jgi:hypothetical protein